ncbi:unnamed protein product [Heterobilharzia americana]|nr:unnamed protein product [Heterobilharzia americana]
MKLDYFLMARIFSAVEAVYHNFNPYHTALHAADVLQAVHCFISHTKLSSILNPTEIFSVLLAAAFHDVDHPGVNQSYLEKTGDFLVDLYKSVSVLEKHHAKVGLCILKESGLSKSLEIKDWEIVRDCFLQVIPATDITYQGIYRKQFTELTKYHIANPSVPFTVSDRTLFMQMVLKCADISNPCRNWPVCEEWAKRVCTELFCQGDRERFQWLLQPIPVMDRTKFTLQRLQIGFIRDMVKPLFIAWHEFCQTGLTLKVLQYLENNLKIWLSQMSDLEVKYPPAFYRLGSLDSQSSDSLTRQQTVSSSFVHADRSDGREENELEISDVKTEIGLHKPLITSVHITTPSSTELEKLKKYESVDSNSCSTSGNLQQTVFITTRVIRRHSLPETQVAIRKTFDFSLSKKSSTVIILKSDPQHIWQSDTSAMLPFTSANNNNNSNNNSNSNNLRISLDKLKLQSLSLHQSATAGTRSANILQMLCEEIINNKSIAKTDLNSMPKSFCFKNNKLQQKILDLNHEQSFLRFSALAHRRRSAPIMEH